jgi:hypothetical protein
LKTWYFKSKILFIGFPLKGFKHYASVRESKFGIQVPWVGMDNDGCKYIDGHCNSSVKKELAFQYPMKVASWYPKVGIITYLMMHF